MFQRWPTRYADAKRSGIRREAKRSGEASDRGALAPRERCCAFLAFDFVANSKELLRRHREENGSVCAERFVAEYAA